MECLMIIDLQEGFLNTENEHIVPLINELVKNYKKGIIMATKYVNDDPKLEELFDYHKLKTETETKLAIPLEKYAKYVCYKNIYSAITSEVKEILEKEKITQVYLAGISTDCCILKTALDLVEMKIKPIVLTKYCASSRREYHENGVNLLKRLIGEKQIKEDI